MKKINVFLLACLIAGLCACDKMLLDSPESNDPVAIFDDLWTQFDKMYGGFEIKDIKKCRIGEMDILFFNVTILSYETINGQVTCLVVNVRKIIF